MTQRVWHRMSRRMSRFQRSFAVRNLIVVGRLTIEEMTTAVAALPPGFFRGDS